MSIKFRAWNGQKMITPAAVNQYGWYETDVDFELGRTVNFERLMMSTGLKDKNGKEVFEGDVFRYEQWHGGVEHVMMEEAAKNKGKEIDWYKNGVILWHQEAAHWIQRDTNDITDMTYHGNTLNVALVKASEVIGNIYENSDLLS